MGILGIILLAVSLSLDALGVGISYGLRKIRIPLAAKLIICFISMFFAQLALLIGETISKFLPKEATSAIGSGMLLILGIFIIFQAFSKKEEKPKSIEQKVCLFSLKPLGITIKIVKDPVLCNFDKLGHITAVEALYLGTALSIDSFGAGIGSAVTGLNSIFIPISVGIFQILFLCGGHLVGSKVSAFKGLNPRIFVVTSGILIITLSIFRFFFS